MSSRLIIYYNQIENKIPKRNNLFINWKSKNIKNNIKLNKFLN